VAYVRTVTTASGAVAVQIVHANRRGSREIEHIGSAHSPGEVEVLKTIARQRLHANQDPLDFDDGQAGEEEAPILASQARHLWDTLGTAYRVLGLDRACPDEVFAQLVLARVIEPTSKLDSIRVLTELGIPAPSYPTIKRRLPEYATPQWRQQLAGACADHVGLGPATLVLYDCSTLYFEIDEGDGFREPGFSKERRLEPQITVGLLTDVRGFPLQVHAFEGNTAEIKTIIPVIRGFADAHGLPGVTVVADAGMMSEANCKDLEDAGLSFIVAAKIPDVPYQVKQWHREHPGQPIADQQVFIQPTVMGPKTDQRNGRSSTSTALTGPGGP
jgi:Transposase DDE domain